MSPPARCVTGLRSNGTALIACCVTTALHHAAEGGHLDVVAKLVIAGCNVSRYDAQGMSPGHLAARHGYHQVMDKLLLAGFALDMQGGLTALHGSVGSTALHIAAQHGHQQVCFLLGRCSHAICFWKGVLVRKENPVDGIPSWIIQFQGIAQGIGAPSEFTASNKEWYNAQLAIPPETWWCSAAQMLWILHQGVEGCKHCVICIQAKQSLVTGPLASLLDAIAC